MAVVVFDPAAFREAYPRFSSELISDAQLEQAFDLACLLLDNTDASPVPYDPERGILIRRTLLWLLGCHIEVGTRRPAVVRHGRQRQCVVLPPAEHRQGLLQSDTVRPDLLAGRPTVCCRRTVLRRAPLASVGVEA